MLGIIAPVLVLLTIIMSLISYSLFKDDWNRACINPRANRIEEWKLILTAAFFGGPGAALAMRRFNHKVKHKDFRIMVPVFSVVQIILVISSVIFGFISFINI